MLRKDLRRIERRGNEYRPKFVGSDPSARRLAARVLGIYQGHVGEVRRTLDAALEQLERSVSDVTFDSPAVSAEGKDSDDEAAEPVKGHTGDPSSPWSEVEEGPSDASDADEGVTEEPDAFKLVRGFAHLLDREATFETSAPIPPRRARRAAFEAAEWVGVTDESSRERALARAGESLGVDPSKVEESLYADRQTEAVLVAFDSRWDPVQLCRQYDVSLAASALFDATEVRVRSSDPKRLVSTAKRHGLLYEVLPSETDPASADPASSSESVPAGEATLSDRELLITGPDAIFRRTRRYGTAFAALLRTLARDVPRWELTATIDDSGRQRTLRLTDADVPAPDPEPVAEPGFDSGVERDFASRFRALDLDWTLRREPEPLETTVDGERRVMIPDFAFEYDHTPFRVFFEVMGFWTPEYVDKKLAQLAGVEDVELLVAVDESLGVGEAIATRDHRVIEYDTTVRVKDVVDALATYESDLQAAASADLPARLTPEADVIGLERLADERGVPRESIETVTFPAHERVGGLLVRPHVVETACDRLEPGMAYDAVESTLDELGLTEHSAVLSELGYRVEWTGLGGGTLRRTRTEQGVSE